MELSPSLVFDPYLPTVSFCKLGDSTGQAWWCLCGPWLLCGAEVDVGEGRRRGQGVGCVQGDPAHVGLSLMSWGVLGNSLLPSGPAFFGAILTSRPRQQLRAHTS